MKYNINIDGSIKTFDTIEELRIYNICYDVVNELSSAGNKLKITNSLYKRVKEELSNDIDIYNNEELTDNDIRDTANEEFDKMDIVNLDNKVLNYKIKITETFQREVLLQSASKDSDLIKEIVENELNNNSNDFDPMSAEFMVDREIEVESLKEE